MSGVKFDELDEKTQLKVLAKAEPGSARMALLKKGSVERYPESAKSAVAFAMEKRAADIRSREEVKAEVKAEAEAEAKAEPKTAAAKASPKAGLKQKLINALKGGRSGRSTKPRPAQRIVIRQARPSRVPRQKLTTNMPRYERYYSGSNIGINGPFFTHNVDVFGRSPNTRPVEFDSFFDPSDLFGDGKQRFGVWMEPPKKPKKTRRRP